ncbi:Cell Wall Hydrolase [Butyrivibrio hungatei DSM 14810]|uniref:Cell Wall Hydrolase n=2 Tax=Butyrivibrio hungatei TaxID=185008 RepID=A0A1M7SMZ9_9FIRM|nr:Cell Wall Hydrolase [Butyrivibrio hungatei DSM 14810]
MRGFKRMLTLTGILSVMAGTLLHFAIPTNSDSIWEEIPHEETETYIQEKRETEDLSVNGDVQVEEMGQCPESISQSSGQVMTDAEKKMLMKVAQAEAGNQGIDGMWLVMSVVMNRVGSRSFPDSIEEVIFQKGAFSSVTDGRYEEQVILSYEVTEALGMILNGEVAENIVAFEIKDSDVLEKWFEYAFTFRDHNFYTEKEQ